MWWDRINSTGGGKGKKTPMKRLSNQSVLLLGRLDWSYTMVRRTTSSWFREKRISYTMTR